MKDIIFQINLTLILLCCIICNSLTAQSALCDMLVFEYDATGNRIKREYKIEPCYTLPSQKEERPEEINEDYSGLKVYPNPVDRNLTIASTTDEQITELFIYDVQGKIIQTTKCQEIRINIDVQHYEPGVYILLVIQGDKKYSYRIIKK